MNQPISDKNIKLFEGNDKIRAQKCLQRIQEVLAQHDCELHPTVNITPAGNQFGYTIVPTQRFQGANN